MPYYTVTPYAYPDIQNRRIAKKMHDFLKEIPLEYHNSFLPLRPRRKGKAAVLRGVGMKGVVDKEPTDPIIQKKIRQYLKYKKRLDSSKRYNGYPRSIPMFTTKSKTAAVTMAKTLDDECGYYRWVQIKEHFFIEEMVNDLVPESKERDYEVLNMSYVDTTDLWFKLVVMEIDETEPLHWNRAYIRAEAPDYLKAMY